MATSRQLARGLAALVVFIGLFGSYLKAPPSQGRARTYLANHNVFENSKAGNLSRYTIIDSGDGSNSKSLIVRELIRAGTPGAEHLSHLLECLFHDHACACNMKQCATGFYPSKSGSPPLHTHLNEEECFKVISGRFRYSLDGVESDELVPGDDVACIPAGHPHNFWNADGTRDLEIEYVVTPPGKLLAFFRTYCGLAQDSKGGTLDSVNPLQLLVTFKHAGMAMNVMPKPIWLMIQYVWVPILERFFQPFYTEYSGVTR